YSKKTWAAIGFCTLCLIDNYTKSNKKQLNLSDAPQHAAGKTNTNYQRFIHIPTKMAAPSARTWNNPFPFFGAPILIGNMKLPFIFTYKNHSHVEKSTPIKTKSHKKPFWVENEIARLIRACNPDISESFVETFPSLESK